MKIVRIRGSTMIMMVSLMMNPSKMDWRRMRILMGFTIMRILSVNLTGVRWGIWWVSRYWWFYQRGWQELYVCVEQDHSQQELCFPVTHGGGMVSGPWWGLRGLKQSLDWVDQIFFLGDTLRTEFQREPEDYQQGQYEITPELVDIFIYKW